MGRILFEVSLMKKLYGGRKAENESRKKNASFSPTRLYKVTWSCRKAPPEFRFDPSGVAHPSQHLFLFLDSQHHPVRGFHIVSINIEIAAISRRIYFEIHFSVSTSRARYTFCL